MNVDFPFVVSSIVPCSSFRVALCVRCKIVLMAIGFEKINLFSVVAAFLEKRHDRSGLLNPNI